MEFEIPKLPHKINKHPSEVSTEFTRTVYRRFSNDIPNINRLSKIYKRRQYTIMIYLRMERQIDILKRKLELCGYFKDGVDTENVLQIKEQLTKFNINIL